MKRITVLGYWFYTIGALIFVVLSFSLDCVVLLIIKAQPNDKMGPLAFSFTVLCTLIILIWALCFFVQFSIITEKGVRTRAICRTIRYLKWEDVKEVRFERLDVSVKGFFTSGWYLIDDGVERKQRNGLVSKKTHITFPATKRARKALETFWHGPIIDEQLKETDT